MPTHQTPQNFHNQNKVIAYLCARWGMTHLPFGVFARADCLLIGGGNPTYLVEVKTRTCGSTEYRDYMIEAAKVEALVRIGSELGITPILAVEFTDGIFVTVLHEDLPYRTSMGGRKDRGERKEMVHIRTSDLQRI